VLRIDLLNREDQMRCLGAQQLVNVPLETGRMSFALFCPHCGEIWGRVYRGEGWFSLSRPCEAHADASSIGGSFFQRYDWWPDFLRFEDWLRKFPRLLEYEAGVHLRWAQRFSTGAQAPQQGELKW